MYVLQGILEFCLLVWIRHGPCLPQLSKVSHVAEAYCESSIQAKLFGRNTKDFVTPSLRSPRFHFRGRSVLLVLLLLKRLR